MLTGKGNVEIGIWNHLDVVPEGKGWIYPPYTCTEKDGYLIGRGVQDNKGPAVAVLYAMKYCREKEILNNIKVRQILGMSGRKRYDRCRILSEIQKSTGIFFCC